jgi:hypothetical protein
MQASAGRLAACAGARMRTVIWRATLTSGASSAAAAAAVAAAAVEVEVDDDDDDDVSRGYQRASGGTVCSASAVSTSVPVSYYCQNDVDDHGAQRDTNQGHGRARAAVWRAPGRPSLALAPARPYTEREREAPLQQCGEQCTCVRRGVG